MCLIFFSPTITASIKLPCCVSCIFFSQQFLYKNFPGTHKKGPFPTVGKGLSADQKKTVLHHLTNQKIR